jgi:hypothetical protein
VFQGSRLRVARRILATGILNRFRQKSGADWTLDYFISQSKIALGTRISSVSPRAMVQICPRAPVSTPISADLGTNSFYGCLTVSRKPFFRPQATSFCIFPRLPAAHLPVSSDLGTYPFSGRLIVNRKPFFRLQATSFCVVPRSPAAHLPKPTKHSTISSTVPASSRTWLSDAKSQCNKPERSSFIASTAVPVVHAETTVMLNAVRATRYTHIQLMPLADTPLYSESSQVITGHFRLGGDAESSTPWFPDLRQPVVGRLEYRQI